jgi:hypothetical protein
MHHFAEMISEFCMKNDTAVESMPQTLTTSLNKQKIKNYPALLRERRPLVGEVSANFCG